jgi:hypothetical protein
MYLDPLLPDLLARSLSTRNRAAKLAQIVDLQYGNINP